MRYFAAIGLIAATIALLAGAALIATWAMFPMFCGVVMIIAALFLYYISAYIGLSDE